MKSCKSFEDQESHAWSSLSGSLCTGEQEGIGRNKKVGWYSENTVGQDSSLFCVCNQTDAKTLPGLLPEVSSRAARIQYVRKRVWSLEE